MADHESAEVAFRTALVVLLGGYGLALLVAPETSTSFWPWPVDAFHGRIYAATFLAPAAGALVGLRRSGRLEDVAVGSALAMLGVAATFGTLLTHALVPAEKKIDFGAGGTWAFFLLNLLALAAGLALVGLSRRSRSAR
jgi:hypothetical protein